MKQADTNEILNRIIVLYARSLPMYLGYAPPDHVRRHPRAAAVLEQIVEDHKRTVDRLGTLILENNGLVEQGEFPMSFTGLHDLSVEYLVKLMVDRQQRFVGVIEKLSAMLNLAPYAQGLVREALGEARGHLENLEELVSNRETATIA